MAFTDATPLCGRTMYCPTPPRRPPPEPDTPKDVLEREILLVDIIEQADDRHAAVAAEDIGITAYDIFVFCLGLGIGIVTVTGIQFTELSLPHVGMGDDVERLITLAIVHAQNSAASLSLL